MGKFEFLVALDKQIEAFLDKIPLTAQASISASMYLDDFRSFCADGMLPTERDETISDGFGSEWSAFCPMCKKKSMQIVRPGKVQCCNCG